MRDAPCRVPWLSNSTLATSTCPVTFPGVLTRASFHHSAASWGFAPPVVALYMTGVGLVAVGLRRLDSHHHDRCEPGLPQRALHD
jgi:hypothetical protein